MATEYSADRPITSREKDRFNRSPFARRLADTIARRSDSSSLVLGIFGKWGDGKTSTLNLIREALTEQPDIVVVPFNPWQFQSEEQLLRAFFATLAAALDQSLQTKGQKIGQFLKRYGGLLSLGSVVGVDAGGPATRLGEALSTVDLDQERGRIEAILEKAATKVVILLDDIDRLDRAEIQAIFRLVKLSASFPYTVYILAFDDEMVAEALGEKYGRGDREAGQQFLEKIIQVPLHLPPVDRLTLRRLAFEGAQAALELSDISLDEETASTFAQHFINGLEVRLVTPRQATRYANALTFALPMLKGEVNTVDQMLIEGVRLFYPRLYTAIRVDSSAFALRSGERLVQQEKERINGIITRALEGLDPSDADSARRLLKILFPRMEGVLGNTWYGADWDAEWAREQRVCSTYYINRYFSYAVPLGDVPDRTVKRAIDLAEAADEPALNEVFSQFPAPGAAARLVEKLQTHAPALSPRVASLLALIVARHGAMFPMDERVFWIASTFAQAALLVRKLVMRSGSQVERVHLAERVIREAQPLPFAAECFRFLQDDKDLAEADQLIPKATVRNLGVSVASRIRDAASTRPPYDEFSDRAPHLLYLWRAFGPAGDLEAYLRARFAQSPAEAVMLLESYVGRVQEMETGFQRRGDLHRGQYDLLAAAVDPEVVLAALKILYGEAITQSADPARDNPPDERIARQFAALHMAVSAGAQGAGADPVEEDLRQIAVEGSEPPTNSTSDSKAIRPRRRRRSR